ncbi:hypothetical protein HHI36_020950 [Cryptolaemus montrouzieri]|uniref:Uncharacterized protein n=1 Tax=Cryptolaemus montrouzieri TaxID=559131 RepID=A0ABD2NCD2_9CUCU
MDLRYPCVLIAAFLRHFHESRGICTIESFPAILRCNSSNIEELLSVYYDGRTEIHGMSIENSDFPELETLPQVRSYGIEFDNSQHRRVAVIRSQVKRINAACFASSTFESLDLSHNKIQRIDMSIFSKIDLTIIDLSHNNIAAFNGSLHRLIRLNFSHNRLEALGDSLVGYKSLKTLDLSYNKLRKILATEFSDIALNHLIVTDNELVFLDPNIFVRNVFTSINLSNNRIVFDNKTFKANFNFLNSLDYSGNNLKNLDFLMIGKTIDPSTFSISSFILNENNIIELNLENVKLSLLDLSCNKIATIPTGAFQDSFVQDLRLNNNDLKQLNASTFNNLSNSLQFLNISYNPLEKVDNDTFKILHELLKLDLSHCRLKNLDKSIFCHSLKLQQLDLSYNNLHSFPERIFEHLSLRHLDVSHNSIKVLPDNVFFGLSADSLNLGHNEILSFQNGVFNNSKIFDLSLNGLILYEITTNTFKGLHFLKRLNLNNLGIRKIHPNSFDDLKLLKHLNLEKNHLETVPDCFLSNTTISELSLKGNNVMNVQTHTFPYNSKLKVLNITITGKLREKNFHKLKDLQELNLANSRISEIPKGTFRGLFSLTKLRFENSKISNVRPGAFSHLFHLQNLDTQALENVTILEANIFDGLARLKFLNMSNKGIVMVGDFAFSGLNSLETLHLNSNAIRNITKDALSKLGNLRILDLSHNRLTGKKSTFPIGVFRDLKNLEELRLQHNQIITFQLGEFSNLGNLKILNVSHNQLTDLDSHLLFPLKQLRVLDVNFNNVIRFDYKFVVKHLVELKKVGIGRNKWKCEDLTVMLHNFQENQVDYLAISYLEYKIENIDGIYCVYMCKYLYCPTEEDLVVY